MPERMTRTYRKAWALIVILALASPTWAEKADRDKDADFTADHSVFDDLKQIGILTGHVVIIKGTMRLTGEEIQYRQNDRGYKIYTVTAPKDGLASFHERRDPTHPGIESTIDGVGEHIDYDDDSGRVVLTHRAIVKFFDNGEQREVVSGEVIVYDSRNDTYSVDGHLQDGQPGRVHGVIPPRKPAAVPGSTTSLKPADQVDGGAR
jgi:lipopolysaccharide export system protein LptA